MSPLFIQKSASNKYMGVKAIAPELVGKTSLHKLLVVLQASTGYSTRGPPIIILSTGGS